MVEIFLRKLLLLTALVLRGDYHITHANSGKKLSSIVKVYDPPYASSTDVYDYIKKNLESWIEKAIEIRGAN